MPNSEYSNYENGYLLPETIDAVVGNMEQFKNIADTHLEFLRSVLGDLSSVKIQEVEPPESMMPPNIEFTDIQAPANTMQEPNLSVLDNIETDTSFPDAPDIKMPDAPTMAEYIAPIKPEIDTDIDVTVEMPDISQYQEELDKIIAVNFDWQEPKYECELFDTLHGKIKGIVSGNDTATGLPIEIEQALFDRAEERESREVLRQKQTAIDTWAARGFELPSGALNKQLDAIEEQGSLKIAALNRDILVQSAQWKIETLRFAIEKGIVLEELCFNIWNNGVNRLFESVRFAFTAAIEKNKIFLTVIETLLKTAQIKTDIIKSKIEVIKARFDAYKTEVSAFAEMISAEKVKFDAYTAQINAENAKMDAYKTVVQAHAERLRSKADIIGQVANAKINKYKADIDAYRANLQIAVSQADLRNTYAKLLTDTNIHFSQLKIEEYKAKLQQASHAAQLSLESMKALGQYSAQLAAGAMSAQHVSASLSASSGYSHGWNKSESKSESHNYTY